MLLILLVQHCWLFILQAETGIREEVPVMENSSGFIRNWRILREGLFGLYSAAASWSVMISFCLSKFLVVAASSLWCGSMLSLKYALFRLMGWGFFLIWRSMFKKKKSFNLPAVKTYCCCDALISEMRSRGVTAWLDTYANCLKGVVVFWTCSVN